MTNMPLPGSVVVGVDGSTHSMRALAEAVRIARLEHRPLHVLHAVDPALWTAYSDPSAFAPEDLWESWKRSAEELISRAVHLASSQLGEAAVTGSRTSGDPRSVLADASTDAYILVVGARGRGGIRAMALGSVSAWLSQHSVCPLIVARTEPSDMTGGIVVATDGTANSAAALEFAFGQASMRHERLTLLHCVEETFRGGYGVFGQLDEELDDLPGHRLAIAESIAGLREDYPDVEVQVELHRGRAATFLTHLSPAPTLLVVGSRHRSKIGAFFGGSVSRATVEHAQCTVAVVPARDAAVPTDVAPQLAAP